MNKLKLMILVNLLLIGCSQIQVQPANPNVVSQIIAACQIDGVFVKIGGRLILSTVPYVGAVDTILAAGVDKVCMNPEKFASDLSTVKWVIVNISRAIGKRYE